MRNLLKKLHIVSNQSEDAEGSNLSSGSHTGEQRKPLSGISGWLQSVASKHGSCTPSSSSNETKSERMEASDSVSTSGGTADIIGQDGTLQEPGSGNSRDPDVEEEYQIQLALELSAREDPEAVQIEAVKQISLGSCAPDNTPAEVVAYRYWNYNSLGYDDKILDGFYDLYGVLNESTLGRMPSLVDLQGTSISDAVAWEAVLVNRSGDSNLLKLEDKALEIAVQLRSDPRVSQQSDLVRMLAVLVSEYMGGSVGNPDRMLRAWRDLACNLKSTLGSMVLPLGSLTIGLARHRALLFKVLADSVGIRCRLVKGLQYAGSADVAMNFVNIEDGREYIVDLMADPGTLIPSDTTGSNLEYDESFLPTRPLSEDINSACVAPSASRATTSKPKEELETSFAESRNRNSSSLKKNKMVPVGTLPQRPNYPYSHARSPSWTEGVSSPAARQMKVRDVSQYMIDAANENPHLAQKLHDVLLESGVVAPPSLFTEVYPRQVKVEAKSRSPSKEDNTQAIKADQSKGQNDHGRSVFLPPRPRPRENQRKQHEPVEAAAPNSPVELQEVIGQSTASQPDSGPVKYTKKVPAAAAAAAAAAVVASSMVVAAAKSSAADSSRLDLPVAAAATATAAAVVATTAAVNREHSDSVLMNLEGEREQVCNHSAGDDSAKSDAAIEDAAEYEIQWEDITLGERIGLGSYGEVYHGDWNGTEVAVKRFLDQDISGESLEEFKSEVRIMKKVRHPNVVLFMGAVMRVPNLSIVTEFLPRGSLYRLLHRPNNQLDERRRLRMALDTARGMNYLHNCNPVIVHRDLKSPNLLVDKNWVVKVCDFGLSRMKHSTFLSSRSTAGTAEWMAPEVLRNEPSNEKCDVYSFGVILWELSTLQQPWGGMNPMQVVGAVGFQHRRLEIPDDMDPAIADIIRKCWQTDPKLRPTFAEIMAALKPLQKPIGPQVPRPNAFTRS